MTINLAAFNLEAYTAALRARTEASRARKQAAADEAAAAQAELEQRNAAYLAALELQDADRD